MKGLEVEPPNFPLISHRSGSDISSRQLITRLSTVRGVVYEYMASHRRSGVGHIMRNNGRGFWFQTRCSTANMLQTRWTLTVITLATVDVYEL